ncbi:MAG TPA: hypothetical protein DCP02_00155 [Actinobacteria bacterium]|nr:hypothetical protein [Actinomycetota bacterium]
MLKSKNKLFVLVIISLFLSLIIFTNCDNNSSDSPPEIVIHCPECEKPAHTRTDAHTPQSVSSDWNQPIRLIEPVNSFCPEDAIEISADGNYLYFMFTEDLLDNLNPGQILSQKNNTYRSKKTGGPGDFAEAVYFDLTGDAASGSFDGELSFSPDGSTLYFHSNRAENTGYHHDPFINDYLDIYIADIVNDKAQNIRNIGYPINTEYPDGEHAIHPDGISLYFTSMRPGGKGSSDIWVSTRNESLWTAPINLESINTKYSELQPAFTADGNTMYFSSDRDIHIGAAIYRSVCTDGIWGSPELIIKGIVGEPSLTADGRYLYFVHVLTDESGLFDADVWYSTRQ